MTMTNREKRSNPPQASPLTHSSTHLLIVIFALIFLLASTLALLSYRYPLPIITLPFLSLRQLHRGTSVGQISPTELIPYSDDNLPVFVHWYDYERCSDPNRRVCRFVFRSYEAFAARATERDLQVRILSVDCRAYRSECDAWGVSSFPALSWHRDGEIVDWRCPTSRPRMDWGLITGDKLFGYAARKIDEGKCPLYELVGEGAKQRSVRESRLELPAPPTKILVNSG